MSRQIIFLHTETDINSFLRVLEDSNGRIIIDEYAYLPSEAETDVTETELYYLQSRYYNSEIGRFLNADGFIGSQGRIGYNIFTYCKNNPPKHADYAGKDAIVLCDTFGCSHIGVLVQDANGDWWHFYWGAGGQSSSWCLLPIDVPVNTWCVEYSGSPDLDGINNAKQYSGDYEYYVYISGDFSSSAEIFKNPSGKYNLYSNNCSQFSFRALATADTEYREILITSSKKILPKSAFETFESEFYSHGSGGGGRGGMGTIYVSCT